MLAIKDQPTQTLRKLRSEYRIYIHGSAKVLNTLKNAKSIASRVEELELAYEALEAVEKELYKRGESVPRAYNPKRRAPKRRTRNAMDEKYRKAADVFAESDRRMQEQVNAAARSEAAARARAEAAARSRAEAEARSAQSNAFLTAVSARDQGAAAYAQWQASRGRSGQTNAFLTAVEARDQAAAAEAEWRAAREAADRQQEQARAAAEAAAEAERRRRAAAAAEAERRSKEPRRTMNPSVPLANVGTYIWNRLLFKGSAISGVANDHGTGRLYAHAAEDFDAAVREARSKGPLRDTFYAVYSYATPIAWWVKGHGAGGEWTIVAKTALDGSVTTNKHLSVVRKEMLNARVVNPAVRGHYDYDDDRSVSSMRVRPLKADRQEKIVRELLADKAHRKAKSHKPKRGHR